MKRNLVASRLLYLATSALFLFLLVDLTPHRVHHSFDQSQATPCLVFSLAKGCHLKPTTAIDLPFVQIAIEGLVLSFEVWVPYLTPSPFSKRAPPLV